MNDTASVTALESKRSTRITADDVYQAADALLIDGQKPTIQGVRAKLGRGSPNTVQEHLDQWWSLLGSRVMGSPGQPLTVPKSVSDALLNLWNLSLREAQTSLQETTATKEAAAIEREAQLASRELSLLARERTLEESHFALRDSLNASASENQAYRERLTMIENDLADERQRLLDSRKILDELTEQLKSTHRELQVSLENRLRERSEANAYTAQVEARAAREIDRARQEIKEAKRRSSELEKAHVDAIKTLKDELGAKRRELDSVRNELRVSMAAQLRHLRKGGAKGKVGRSESVGRSKRRAT